MPYIPSTLDHPDFDKDASAARFLATWNLKIEECAKLHQTSEPPQISVWEGLLAYRELITTGTLYLILPEPDMDGVPLPFVLSHLYREVSLYRHYSAKIIPVNAGFRLAIKAVMDASKIFRMARGNVNDQAPGHFRLSRCLSSMENAKKEIEKERAAYWKDRVVALPEELARWPITFTESNDIEKIVPKELIEYEKRFGGAKYPSHLGKRIDLDRRFQTRVALLLRAYLRHDSGVSLRTIARLTVLTYVAGELGKENNDGELIIPDRKKPVTVSNVDTKLRGARLK